MNSFGGSGANRAGLGICPKWAKGLQGFGGSIHRCKPCKPFAYVN